MASIQGSTDTFVAPPSVGYLVWRLAVKWRTEMDRALTPVALTSAQYAVLASLGALGASGGSPSQRELADFAGLEPMFVSKLVRALESRGLLTRSSRSEDTRARELSLTDAGRAAVTAGRAIVVDLERDRLAALGGAESHRSAQFTRTLQDLLA